MSRRLGDSARAFRDVFRNHNLRWLELGWASSIIGHWAYLVAVNVFAYEKGGASAVGVLVLIRMLPAAFVAPFAGSLADRYRRTVVMLTSNLVRATIITAAGLGVLFGVPPAVIYVLAALAMLVGTPFRPAMAATTPSAAQSPTELTAANAVASTIESLGFFCGPAIAGILLAVTSTWVVFLLTAGGFALGALFISRIKLTEQVTTRSERSNIFSETLVGFRTVVGDSRLRIVIGLFSAQTLVGGIFVVLVVVMAISVLGMGNSGVGYLNSAFGVGALVGSFIALSLTGLRRLAPPFVVGVVLWGVPLVLIGIKPEPALAMALLFVVGIGSSIADVAAFTLIQRAVPEHVLARVFGVIQMLWVLTVGIGGLIAVPLVNQLGARTAIIIAGASLPLLVALLGPPLIRIDALATPPGGAELSLLASTPIFAPLPGTTLEHVATRLTPLRLEPGSVIVRQGDEGDRFYLVAEGTLDVSEDGRQFSELEAGDYFGEIALLRDVPRTATVTAKTAVVLYALDRDDFLAAVTSHAPSAQAAESVVSARLSGVPEPSSASTA